METRISFITDNWLVILTHLPPKRVKRHYKTMFTPHHQHWACSQDHHSCQRPLPRDHHCMKDTLHWHLTSQRHRTKTCSSSAVTISHTKATHIQTGAYCVGQCPQHHTDHPRHFMNGCHIDRNLALLCGDQNKTTSNVKWCLDNAIVKSIGCKTESIAPMTEHQPSSNIKDHKVDTWYHSLGCTQPPLD